MTDAIVFDDGLGLLSPLTDLRAAFDVRTGAMTSLDRLMSALDLNLRALFVPDSLGDLYAETASVPINQVPDGQGDLLLINGRCPYPLVEIDSLSPGEALEEEGTGHLVAARVGRDAAPPLLSGERTPEQAGLRVKTTGEPVLLARPWDVRTARDTCIEADLELLADRGSDDLPEGVCAAGEGQVVIEPGAVLFPGVVLDVTSGPVHIARGAVVRPGAVIAGPAYVGERTVVLDRAVIKPNTAIGPVCKVGGEVGGCIFQGYSNKAHDGHLGDSWIGQWVNLGAGTTNSNLLNTYGEVRARATPRSEPEATGHTFLGAVIGDHVKTAICTRIMTGAVIGTGAMWAAGAPIVGCVPPFSWTTDAGQQPYRLEHFVEVLRRQMARRERSPSPAYLGRIERLAAVAARGTLPDRP